MVDRASTDLLRHFLAHRLAHFLLLPVDLAAQFVSLALVVADRGERVLIERVHRLLKLRLRDFLQLAPLRVRHAFWLGLKQRLELPSGIRLLDHPLASQHVVEPTADLGREDRQVLLRQTLVRKFLAILLVHAATDVFVDIQDPAAHVVKQLRQALGRCLAFRPVDRGVVGDLLVTLDALWLRQRVPFVHRLQAEEVQQRLRILLCEGGGVGILSKRQRDIGPEVREFVHELWQLRRFRQRDLVFAD